MVEALVHITTTVISGCIVALFTYWLRTRNNKKKGDISQHLKSLTIASSEGIGAYNARSSCCLNYNTG